MSIKCFVLVSVLALFLGTSALAEPILTLPLDDVKNLGTTIRSDATVRAEGRAAVRITTQWPTTICLGVIPHVGVDNSKLIFQAQVKSQELQGTAFLEMWCRVAGAQYFSRGMDSVVTGNMDWKTLETPFVLQAGQKAETVTLNIVINGKGTVWVDDVRIRKTDLE